MTYELFGLQYDLKKLASILDEEIKKMPQSVIDTKYGLDNYLRSLYYNLFIAKDGEKFNPLNLVTVNDTVDLNELGPLMTFIGNYRKDQIMERYGLNLVEYMRLPKYVVDIITLDATMETKSQSDRQAEFEREKKKEERQLERAYESGS